MWFRSRRQRPDAGPASRSVRAGRRLERLSHDFADTAKIPHSILQFFAGQTGAATALWLVESDELFQVVSTFGTDCVEAARFAAHGRLARWLRVNAIPVFVPGDVSVLSFVSEGERAQLESLSPGVCVPLVAGQTIEALVLLRHISRDALRMRDDIEALSRQAAVTAQRARQLGEQRAATQAALRTQQLADVGQMAAAIAHEVRNPLTTIRSSVQYLLATPVHDRANEEDELLQQVVHEVDRINRSLTGILGLSKPPSTVHERVNLVDVLNDALVLFRPHVTHQKVALEQNVPPEMVVHGNAGELKQVVLNVLLNACQSMPQGGSLIIDGRPSLSMSGERIAELRFTDTGHGIPLELMERVFDPFVTTKATGSGLGLAICKKVLDTHAGGIVLQSAPGAGTTVTLTLPLVNGADHID